MTRQRFRFGAVFLAVGLAGATVRAGGDRPSGEAAAQRERSAPGGATSRDTQRFTVAGGSVLDLSNVSGDVRVVTGGAGVIQVESLVRSRVGGATPRGSSDDLEIRQVGSRVEVRARLPRSRGRSVAIDLTVTVPDDASVNARSVSGDLTVAGVRGDVRLETVSGAVGVAQAPNVTLAKSVSGDVTVRDVASDGGLILSSVSGAIVATDLRVRSLEAGSVSGDVRMTGVAAQRILAKSISGDVDVAGTLSRGGRFEFTSHSGDVRLRLPAGVGLDLSADAHSGRIHSDFPVTLRGTGGGRSARAVRGVIGDAGAVVIIRTFSGDVTLSRQ